MKRGDLFWGLLLITLGGLFFLQARGLISSTDIWGYFGPLALVFGGGWILTGALQTRRTLTEASSFNVPLDGAEKIHFEFNTGMGQVFLGGGAPDGLAVRGASGVSMNVNSTSSEGVLRVEVDTGPSIFPIIDAENGEWRFELNESVPLSLELNAGASGLELDLSRLRLTTLEVNCGASRIGLTLPEAPLDARLQFEMGAASLEVRVPQEVALRLEVGSGANALSVDETRFLPREQGKYQSPDFESASRRVTLKVEGGANSITVR